MLSETLVSLMFVSELSDGHLSTNSSLNSVIEDQLSRCLLRGCNEMMEGFLQLKLEVIISESKDTEVLPSCNIFLLNTLYRLYE